MVEILTENIVISHINAYSDMNTSPWEKIVKVSGSLFNEY